MIAFAECRGLFPQKENLLQGKKVAVIGGGPAGAFTGYLFSKVGADVDLFEPRKTAISVLATAGRAPLCTGCAGWVQNDAINLLGAYGIQIPENVIQEKLDDAVIHLGTDNREINLHLDQSTVTVYRGYSPLGLEDGPRKSFDAFLLDQAIQAGVRHHEVKIKKIDLSNSDGEVNFVTDGGEFYKADLVVGAFGHNPGLMENISYSPFSEKLDLPVTQKASVREYYLGEKKVRQLLQGKIHIFGNPTKDIWFSAIVPKHDFISVVLIGRKDIRGENFNEYFASVPVTTLLGNDFQKNKPGCACLSTITLHSPKRFSIQDVSGNMRMVNIGDAGPTRPRDNGIYAALNSARYLVETLMQWGNSSKAVIEYNRFIQKEYIDDNFWVDRTLEIIDLILNHSLPREIVIYLAMHKVPFLSPAILEAITNVVTGKTAYQNIPLRMFQAGLRGTFQNNN